MHVVGSRGHFRVPWPHPSVFFKALRYGIVGQIGFPYVFGGFFASVSSQTASGSHVADAVPATKVHTVITQLNVRRAKLGAKCN